MANKIITIIEPQTTSAGLTLAYTANGDGTFSATLYYNNGGYSFQKTWNPVPAGGITTTMQSLMTTAVNAAKADPAFWPGA